MNWYTVDVALGDDTDVRRYAIEAPTADLAERLAVSQAKNLINAEATVMDTVTFEAFQDDASEYDGQWASGEFSFVNETDRFVSHVREWAGIAHEAWAETDGEETITVLRAFFGVGIDHVLNAATLIELKS